MLFKYIQEITRDNWGFPWHIILANTGAVIGLIITYYLFPETGFLFKALMVALVINVIGLINELLQKKSKSESRIGFWQDIFGNNIGIIIGIVEVAAVLFLTS